MSGAVTSDAKPKTARSYRASVVGDNTVISLNIKWLIQVLVAVAAVIYGYFQIENLPYTHIKTDAFFVVSEI